MRVLVADDDETTRRVVLRVLQAAGHDACEASSAEEALKLFRNDSFALVITDIYMERMTGLDLLDEIKQHDPGAMVVVMTSNASIETATSALRSGAYDYLVKPFEDLHLITAAVSRAIDRHRLDQRNRMLMEDLRRNGEELERLNSRLTDMVNRDGLTGLHNHRYFREAIELEVSRCRRHSRRFALLFLDVDDFKSYNDTHGHLAGDALLRDLATLLQGRSRGETLAARYGGEEFVLIVPEADAGGARRYAEILRKLIESHPFAGRETQPLGKVTISLGVSCYPESGEDPASLIDHADRALYRSKRAGRNSVTVWEPSLV